MAARPNTQHCPTPPASQASRRRRVRHAATLLALTLTPPLTPQDAVISVGLHNTFGHPRPEVIQRLHDAHARVFRTDQFRLTTSRCVMWGYRRTFDHIDVRVREPCYAVSTSPSES